MRIVKRYIPVFLLSMIIWFVVDNADLVTNFFNQAESHLTQKFGEFHSDGYLVNNDELAGLEDSGITGSDYSFDTDFYPYYDILTVEGQILYKQIYANMKQMKSTFVPIINIHINDIQTIMEAVYNDHPELFWINTSYTYKYTENNIVVQITLSYNDTIKNIEKAQAEFDAATSRIINYAKTLSSDYEKEEYVHNEILKLVSYNTNAAMNQSAYSALVNKETVCAGYARAFQYIMIELGIPTYYVPGYSNQEHAWNIVKLSDGYYNIDLTWNDATQNHYQYFNKTDSEFQKTHTRNNLSIQLPKCQGTYHTYSNHHSENTSNSFDKTNLNANNTESINTNSNVQNNYLEVESCSDDLCYNNKYTSNNSNENSYSHHEDYHHSNNDNRNNYSDHNHHHY